MANDGSPSSVTRALFSARVAHSSRPGHTDEQRNRALGQGLVTGMGETASPPAVSLFPFLRYARVLVSLGLARFSGKLRL